MSAPNRRSPKEWLPLTSALLCMWALTSLWAATAQVTIAAEAQGARFTVQTVFQFPLQPESTTLQAVSLAGLSAGQGDFPSALNLVWTNQESSSFFPTWELQLHSDRSLLPSDARSMVRPSSLFDTHFVKIDAPIPVPGHSYETTLSYDSVTGGLSVWLKDRTAGQLVYKEGLRLSAPTKPLESLHPAGGLVREGDGAFTERFKPFPHITAHPRFIPRSVEWGLFEVRSGATGSVPIQRLIREQVEGAAIQIKMASPVQGKFRFFLTDGASRNEILEILPSGDTMSVPIDVASLPLGSFQLGMEYWDEGRVWFTDVQALTVGEIRARATPLTFDPDTDRARGTLTLDADGNVPPVPIKVSAQLLRMAWHGEDRAYRYHPEGTLLLYDQKTPLSADPFLIPLEIESPDGAPGLWQVDLHVEVGADLPVFEEGPDPIFATFEPVRLDPGEPFTVAVLPDTQYYSYKRPSGGHPEIFLRQLAWLGEHAERERIALALHLGDITNTNHPGQWEAAQRSIYLLDGVMPYVLAVGNHDMGPGGNSETRETSVNVYFPPERYETLPSFGGLFRPDELENSYHSFTLGGKEYLVLSLEFLPRDDVLHWANNVVAAHPHHAVIVITHYYMSRSGGPSGSYGTYALQDGPPGSVNSGREIWEKLVRKHPNMLMVMSGHLHHDAAPRQVRIGDHGNPVYQMLFDYQGAPNGGNGWLSLLRFFPEREKIGVAVYSPYLDEMKLDVTDRFDVPFCIDLVEGKFTDVDAACAPF